MYVASVGFAVAQFRISPLVLASLPFHFTIPNIVPVSTQRLVAVLSVWYTFELVAFIFVAFSDASPLTCVGFVGTTLPNVYPVAARRAIAWYVAVILTTYGVADGLALLLTLWRVTDPPLLFFAHSLLVLLATNSHPAPTHALILIV